MTEKVRRAAYLTHCAIIKHWGRIVSLAMVAVLIGVGGQLIIGRTQLPTFWIVWGGNTDPGDGNGNGLARQQFIAGGWTDEANSFQVTWKAAIEQGTVPQTNEAMAAGKDAWNRFCANGKRHCINAGFSLGVSPALQLSEQVGIPSEDTYVFGGPQPATGIWHNQFQDNPFVEPAITMFGQINPDRFVPEGTQVFFDVRDPFANSAPQCAIPFALSGDGHRIIRKDEAEQHVWIGPDGAVIHEAGYVAPPGLPLSGADPSPPWAFCQGGDWKNTPYSPGPQVNPDNPAGNIPGGLPSLPVFPTSLPGLPTGG